MVNIIKIHAIRKTSSLPKPLKTLLLSLAVSGLGVGLLCQLLYIADLVMTLEPFVKNNPVNQAMNVGYYILTSLLPYGSFFGVTALTVDRFLAIHLHLRYQELVTHKRVVAAVILIWVITAFLSFLLLLVIFGWISINWVTQFYPICLSIEVSGLKPNVIALLQDLFGCTAPRKSNRRPSSTKRPE